MWFNTNVLHKKMKKYLLTVLSVVSTSLLAQNSKFNVNVYYGAQNNFSVDYDRHVNKTGSSINPIVDEGPGFVDFFQKNSIGTVYGGGFHYKFNEKNGIGIDYNQTENTGKYNVSYVLMPEDFGFEFINFKIRQKNRNLSLLYTRYNIFKNFNAGAGVGFMFSDMQEVSIAGPLGYIILENSNFTDLTVPIFVNYTFINNAYFKLGVEARTNYVYTLESFEDIMIFPFLRFKL